MNIVLSAELFRPGTNGMITAVSTLSEDLSAVGHSVTLVCPASEAAMEWGHQKRVTIVGAVPVAIPLRIQQHAGLLLPMILERIREAVRRADVVHLHSPLVLGPAVARCAREENVPVVVTSHVLPANLTSALRFPLLSDEHLLSRMVWHWIGRGIHTADLITAPTEFAARVIRRRFNKVHVQVISNGVRQGVTTGVSPPVVAADEPLRAIYVGRLQREKRVDELLAAVRVCLDQDVDVRLTIVGDGPDRRRLERIARRLRVLEATDFMGVVSDLRRDAMYAQSHCLWMASQAELQSCVALEAMAAARPVVAARSGALPETVPDGFAGRLFAPGNSAEIAWIMRGFRAQPNRYYQLCRGAAATAAKHTSVRVRAAFENAYSSISGSRRAGRPPNPGEA